MQGKVFKNSMNLHQDQARILFNYYRKAAEKIVKEETDLENSISQAKSEIELAKKEKIKGIVILSAFPALGIGLLFLHPILCAVALGSIWGLITLLNAIKSEKENETKINTFEEAHRDIRRDYSIKKMGLVYVPVATKVPFEGKSFMVDHTGEVGDSHFQMSVVHKPGELLESLINLEDSINNVPIVEEASMAEEIDTSDYSTSIQRIKLYDYMGNIDRLVRNIRYLLNDSDTVSLSLPVVLPESETAAFMKEYASTDTGDKPVVPVFNVEGFKEKLDSFYTLNDMRNSFKENTNENQVEYFRKLIGRLAESVQLLSKTKISSSNKIVDYTNMILSSVFKASFNQYSPALEAEEIERIRSSSFDYQDSVDDYTPFSLKSSSRVKYDLFSTSWIAEDQSRTSMPFGMHQIQEEVLSPVIQNLMNENRVDRLAIYNGIKDQKIDYLNQWHRDTEDFYGRNRAEAADLINSMRETYADYMRSLNTYKALQETQTTMSQTRSLDSVEVQQQNKETEMIAGFELQAQQFKQKQDDFSDFMDRLKDNIDERAAEFGYIPYYEATLRDKEYRDIAQATDHLQDMDPRRKRLISVSPYVAKHAKLPPTPNVEQKMYDDFAINLLEEAAKTESSQEDTQSAFTENADEVMNDSNVVDGSNIVDDSNVAESGEENSGEEYGENTNDADNNEEYNNNDIDDDDNIDEDDSDDLEGDE